MKVAFVHYGRENLGVEYLSAYLRQKNHKTYLIYDPGLFSINDNVFQSYRLEKKFALSTRQIIEKIIAIGPDIVAFSVYTNTYQWCLKIAAAFKSVSDIPVVFGGAHPTFLPEKVLENDCVDFVVVGEGEECLVELLDNIEGDKTGIKNLFFRNKKREIIKNGVRAPLDINRKPPPDKSLFAPYVRFKDDYLMLGSVGCPNNCSYCSEEAYHKLYQEVGKFFRRRSVKSVIEELVSMKEKYGFREVMFFDSIFFSDKSWLRKFSREYKSLINVPFRCEGHVEFFDEETAELIKSAGCYCIDFGVQTLNEEIRKKWLKRRESNECINRAFEICDKYRIKYDVDIMYGLPEESEGDFVSVLDFFANCRFLNRIKTYYLTYYPGCSIIKTALENELISKEDVREINEGRKGEWFHSVTPGREREKQLYKKYDSIFKLYALLPVRLRRWFLNSGIYDKISLPGPVVVLCQVVNACLKKDYRFTIYPKKYLHQTVKILRSKYIHKKAITIDGSKTKR